MLYEVITTIMFVSAWIPIVIDSPIARYLPNGSLARKEMRKPRNNFV